MDKKGKEMEWCRGWTREGKEREWGRKVDKERERKGDG